MLSEKVLYLSNLEPIWPTFGPNLTHLTSTECLDIMQYFSTYNNANDSTGDSVKNKQVGDRNFTLVGSGDPQSCKHHLLSLLAPESDMCFLKPCSIGQFLNLISCFLIL